MDNISSDFKELFDDQTLSKGVSWGSANRTFISKTSLLSYLWSFKQDYKSWGENEEKDYKVITDRLATISDEIYVDLEN